MNEVTVIIVEDEIPAQRRLAHMISSIRPKWKVLGMFESVVETNEWLAENKHPDLMFLDIRLSDGFSFEILKPENKVDSFVIFTTAYDEYALQAFKVNSIDYLLKPFGKEELESACTKFGNLFAQHKKQVLDVDLEQLGQLILQEKKTFRKRFLIHQKEDFYTLESKDIAYFYLGKAGVTLAVDRSAKTHIIDMSLDRLAEQFDPMEFFRLNRRCLAHIESIKKLTPQFSGKMAVYVTPEYAEPFLVSKDKVSLLKKWLNR
ncbi:LytR/AlgR family response regulator transcription factor [Aureibacter tunicatorum]|uniref:DNA-binding LytR/AlgR family response regulator n=1 Tax=Aureibacter tunicatorum TaxID=866807 RepID=A0AAE3XPE9_9BACT|nr:LytTR family DNA-binding domain-containing protein [Aureibacter tunicatorum]MDR6240273.1 DNA-binding LytR/AlgR family response regulator [Aureibacter tunicatorum]BDD05846.1 DNA-binding response regulator [Aureibacter tunicatorum]